ncbi:GH35 family endo-1,4-beta-xylanase [Paenibacillus cellulosilyticus]|uniref:Beta-xylanase n=1 Tax=Paenibacillus cellulosilyticus TaxID=375489 RepID=A0A2V2YSJ4_9BACL|nr:endo-1,4-beta-xylanase [Paenibacillus cellulosilyticus]PWV97900.1 GH35 family endo-1,4-beta-xylanase [Paenibacillus cellulosilyticus]QKS46931.1 endo-1,4-beta-xylanase [Paenibacillus cellulosilyticus]
MRKLGIAALGVVLAAAVIVPPSSTLPVAHADTVKLTSTFEDGTLQGWAPRIGSESVTLAGTAGARSGSQGMLVANRTATYQGASKDVLSQFTLGTSYTVTGYVKLTSGTANTNVTLSMQKTVGTTTTYENLATVSASASDWVKVEATYRLSSAADALSIYFESAGATISFYVDDFSIVEKSATPIEASITPLKTAFASYFPIGTAFTNDEMYGENANLMKKHFASVTPGNALKWDATEPTEGSFNFTSSDEAVQFAVDNGMKVRGHTLVWHNQTPNWVFYDSNSQLVTKEVLYARLKAHIDAVVGRYKGKIYAWDVANEVIDESQSDGMRRSLWYQIAGDEYIEKAFEYAHAADPDAKLFINDYNTHIPAKAQFLHDLVQRLKAKGVPIDGIGEQTHINIDYPALSQIEDSIVKFSDLGVTQEITELDMSIYTSSSQSYTSLSTTLATQQATRYAALFEIFKKYKDQISNVTFWGQDDAHSWLRTSPVTRLDWPLLFDDNLQSKSAYWSLVNALTVPAAPTNVTATAGNAQAVLSWTASTGATSYTIKRATTSGGPYTNVATGVTATSYTNTGLTNGTTYYYVISAVNANGEGANSTQASVTPTSGTTVPAAPTSVAAAAGNTQATLTWTASSGATSYNIKRATTSGGTYTTVATGVTTTSYTNTGLTNGTTYYYVVSAVNSAGESANSSQASVTPTAGSTGTSSLVLQYRAGNTNATDNAIQPFFNIKNTGTTAINLSDLTIRYYFTKEGTADMTSWIDYAQIGGSNVLRTFGTLSATNADTYVELSFSSSAGTLQPGAQTGEIQLRMHKSDWSTFNEANDYSFDATKTTYTDWTKVTLYQSGVKVWGVEPS